MRSARWAYEDAILADNPSVYLRLDAKRQGRDLAVAATCFALIAVLALVAGAISIAQAIGPASSVTLKSPEPFAEWSANANVPTPDVVIDHAPCPGSTYGHGICVKPATAIMHFPAERLTRDHIKLSYYHELGHVFQLANPAVQSGWPAVDAGCEGTYSFTCAERFADAYRDCAVSDRKAHERDPYQFNRDYKPTQAEHALACDFIADS